LSRPRDEASPIVVGYDASDAARRAVTRAGQLAGDAGRIVLVAVAPTGARNALGDAILEATPPEEIAELLDGAETMLSGSNVTVETRDEEGDVAEAIIRTAREVDAEFIVVGARGRDFVARTLLGSVAAKLVERAPCDVVVVR
jgi:nucleotide-binding universal stress UspA family protein